MILNDLKYFSNSFFEGYVVWKNWALTNTCCPTWKSSPRILCVSVGCLYYCYAANISVFRVSCSLLKSIANSQAQDEVMSLSRYIVMLG